MEIIQKLIEWLESFGVELFTDPIPGIYVLFAAIQSYILSFFA